MLQYKRDLTALLFAKHHKQPAISFHKINEPLLLQYDFQQLYCPALMPYRCIGLQSQMLFGVLTGLWRQDLNKRSPSLHRHAHKLVPVRSPAENTRSLYSYQRVLFYTNNANLSDKAYMHLYFSSGLLPNVLAEKQGKDFREGGWR